VSETDQSFRNRIATITEEGNRAWVYPKKPKGRLTNYRRLVAWLLLAAMVAMPLIRIDGNPFMKFDILKREFFLFGMGFWPQDFHLLVIATITSIVFIILFTVVFGRIWCGWACPQTIFLEMVFRPIEYLIEGDAAAQRKLNTSPWTAEKLLKKTVKHAVFWVLSFILSNIFLAYIIGTEALFEIISSPVGEHLQGFIVMLIFTSVFYWIYASFREQICVLVCPYGRLQGVLLDQRSVVVAYDFVRGEPREKLGRHRQQQAGDCIDCNQCVQVCPTGIDIRNGTQLECVNCTACIDACNDVMDKVDKPRGLIRYDSYEGISSGKTSIFNARTLGYTAILTILITLLIILFAVREPVETVILRTPGIMYQKLDDGRLMNLYNIKVINKTSQDMDIRIELLEPKGTVEMVGGFPLPVKGRDLSERALFVRIEKEQLTGIKTNLKLAVFNGEELIGTVKSSFIGPPK